VNKLLKNYEQVFRRRQLLSNFAACQICGPQLMVERRRRSSPGCSSQAMQLVARLCMDRGDPPAWSVRPVVRRCLRSGSLGSGTMRQFTICSYKNIDLFTNLRPGRIARDVRQYAQKGSDYSLPFHLPCAYSSYDIRVTCSVPQPHTQVICTYLSA
jgi:hypothetical protein